MLISFVCVIKLFYRNIDNYYGIQNAKFGKYLLAL
jgi:hypothetical protein